MSRFGTRAIALAFWAALGMLLATGPSEGATPERAVPEEAAPSHWPDGRTVPPGGALPTTVLAVTGPGLISLIIGVVLLRRFVRRYRDEQRARTAAETSERRCRELIEGLQDYAIVMLDREGRVISWNSGAEIMSGYRAEEILGKPLARFYSVNDVERGLPGEDLALARSRGRWNTDGWRERKDGSRFWAECSLTALRDEAGALKGFSQVTRDASERRAAQEQLRTTNQALQALIEASPLATLTLDVDFRVKSWNPAAERVFGWCEDEVIGRPLPNIPLQDRPRYQARVAQLRLGRSVIGEESRRTTRDGRQIDVSLWASPLRDGEGAFRGAIVLMDDISQRKRAEEEAARNAIFRERIIGIVGHDLRNPLGAIQLAASLIARQSSLDPSVRRSATRILSSTERMTRMVSDLLDFTVSRLGGGFKLQRRETDFYRVCREIIDELEAPHPDHTLTLEGSPGALGLVDPDRLAQVVSNLVGNALAYSPAHSHVRMRVRADADRLSFVVHNEGPPIPSDLVAHLFEPFRRGDHDDHQRSGLGLGLYISREIVVAHGGEIEVTSSEQEGTTFEVVLPRTPFQRGVNEGAEVTPAVAASA